MNNKIINNSWAMWLTFILGILLQVMPFPSPIEFLKPNWLMLIIIFWIIALPEKVGMTRACIVGLIYDLFSGTILGVNGFILTFIAFLTLYKVHLLKNLALWQQTFVIILFSLIYILWLYFFQIVIYRMITINALIFLSSLLNGIIWLGLYFALKAYQNLLKID